MNPATERPQASSIEPGVSVIICCHNSENRIIQTLRHLSNQVKHHRIPYEILLIDNRCDDHTVSLSQSFWNETGTPYSLSVYREDRKGQAFARLTGAYHAKYSIVVFVDDDNWLSSNYLATAYEMMSSYADAAIIGGKTTAEFESAPPDWFYTVCGAYAVGGATRCGKIDRKDAEVFGAGMVVRTSFLKTLLECGYEPLNSGRAGRVVTSGDDSELCILANFMGLGIYEFESLMLKHYMPTNRLTWENTLKLHRGFGASYKPLIAENIYRKRRQIIRTLVRCTGIYTFLRILGYHLPTLLRGQFHRFRVGDPKALIVEKAKGAVAKAFHDIPRFRKSIKTRIRLLHSLETRSNFSTSE